MTKQQIVDFIHINTGLTAQMSWDILDAFTDTIRLEMATGGRVCLTNFGTWTASRHKIHKFRNLQTGVIQTAPAFNGVHFRASAAMMATINR